MYNNINFIERQIMGENKHAFLYGYNIPERDMLLKDVESKYTSRKDNTKPLVIYTDALGLPKMDYVDEKKQVINRLCRNYLDLTIAEEILKKCILMDTSLDTLDFISYMNSFVNCGHKRYDSITDVLCGLISDRNRYLEKYRKYALGINGILDIDDVSFFYLDLSSFIRKIKETFNIAAPIVIIYNHKDMISSPSTFAINDLIASGNKELILKVATEPNNWSFYYTSEGKYIEMVNDYYMVKLDDSYLESKKNRNIKIYQR